MAATGQKKSSSAAQSARNPGAPLVDKTIYDSILPEKDAKTAKFSTKKKALIKQNEPGNWKDNESTKPNPRIPDSNSKPATGPQPTALVNTISNRLAATYPTGKPYDESSDMVLCKHCKKPVFKPAAPGHIRDCLRKKQEKIQKKKEAKEAKDAALRKERNGGISPDPPGDDVTKGAGSAKKRDGEAAGAKKTGKKRKADDDGKAPATKKKKKEEPKPKTAKNKGPVDVEKQCGVITPNGTMCARSLTCKSHSMGAKRAVPGRSMPYDMLLNNYQKKNQARMQRAAMDANAPLQDDFEPQGTVDSDEERDAFMAGIQRYMRENQVTGGFTMGAPLDEPWSQVPLVRRYNYVRFKGQLQQAISSGVNGGKLFAPPPVYSDMLTQGEISASLETPEFDGSRRPSIASQRRGSRKPSISGSVGPL